MLVNNVTSHRSEGIPKLNEDDSELEHMSCEVHVAHEQVIPSIFPWQNRPQLLILHSSLPSKMHELTWTALLSTPERLQIRFQFRHSMEVCFYKFLY